MKTITLVAFNRLPYLKTLVESLRANNLDGYTLFVGVEPGSADVEDYCRSLDFMPTQVLINAHRLGVAANPLATISRAFDSGSNFNVALEDDLILSPDALDIADWFCNNDTSEFHSLNLFNYRSLADRPTAIEITDHFIPLGWACTRAVWESRIKVNWWLDSRGWDFSINESIAKSGGKILQPCLARSNHIGREGGEHCTPEFHDHTFSGIPISDGREREYFLKR